MTPPNKPFNPIACVWRHPENGAPDEDNGSDYFYCFGSYAEALEFSEQTKGAEAPLALTLETVVSSVRFRAATSSGRWWRIGTGRLVITGAANEDAGGETA